MASRTHSFRSLLFFTKKGLARFLIVVFSFTTVRIQRQKATMSDPCKAEACEIQFCLKTNNYDESKCTKVIDQLYACCTEFYKEEGKESRSPCCPIPSLLELKIKQREKEELDAKLITHKNSYDT